MARWNPYQVRIVLPAPAGNGDGVLAGALGGLTERASRPFASQLIYQMNCDGVFSSKKSPGNATGAKLLRNPIRTPEYDGARKVRAESVS